MKIRKKILSIMLSLSMAVTMFPYSVFAAGEEPTSDPSAGTEVVQEEPVAEASASASDEMKTDDTESVDAAPGESSDDQSAEATNRDTPAVKGSKSASEDGKAASADQEADTEKPEQKNEDPEDPELRSDDEEAEETTAGYSEKSGVEAAEVTGEAAESKTEAKEALSEETDIPSKRVKSVVKELFYDAKAANIGKDDRENDGDEGTTDPDKPPRSGDGSNIENISAKWITPDTVNNDDAALLYVKPNRNEEQSVRLQINYALSGEHSYDPGDIVITVPAYIFKNRNGQDYGNMIIPYPEDPSKRGDFNWKLVGDHYEITNTKRMSAATKGFIQFQIEGMYPNMLVDMQTSEPFDALIEVTTHKGNLIALRSNELTAQFDTEAKLTNVNKRSRTVSRVKASQIPESQRVEGETEYIKVDWYVWGTTYANTYYTIKQTDNIPQDSVVSSRKVVADEDLKNVSKEISLTEAKALDPSYEIGDSVVLKESDIHGFVIGGNSSDTTSVTKNNVYHGASDGNGQYYSFSTAYPASQFQKDVEYTFTNRINYTVTEDDPEVTENTNPNVQEVDPKLVTGQDRYATANVTWSYTDPKWIDPSGHYMVTKNGNDDKAGNNTTHRNTYTSNDLHLHNRAPYGYTNGWYGIYPSALNQLQDVYEKSGENGSIRLSYSIDTVGYTLPWMYDGGVKEFHEGQIPARIIGNYNRPIRITTKDTGISIGRNGEKLTVFDDYTFEEIEFPESPYVYKGKPQNIEPDGSWTALDHGDGTFKYTRDENKSNWPDITLQIQRNGEWEDYAVASWKSGSRVVTLTSGGTAANGIVKVPADTQNFRTIVTLNNTEGGEGATEAIQAAIDYDVRAVVNLKSTNEMIALIEDAFTKSNTPSMAVYNGVNMLVERSDVAETSAEREILSLDREGYDSIRGYTTDTAVYPYKSSTQKLKEVDYEARTILIHYTAKVEERSVISDKKTWEEAVREKRLVTDNTCVWRDLLPKGVTPLTDTVKLRAGDTFIHVPYTIENYEGTHRTLLVVEANLTPTPQTYRSGDMYYYEDVPTISFDAIYDFESLIDYGYELHNVIAYESGNKQLGTIQDYSGEPDDPTLTKHKNIATEQAFNEKDAEEKAKEKAAMTNLDTDPEHNGYENFVYAGAWTKIDILSAARTSLYKDVQVNNDGIWSEGTYYKDIYDDPPKEATEDGRMRTVYEGGQYKYRLRVMSDPSTISSDLIIYDSLENFYATGSSDEADNDPIDYIAPEDWETENDPHWRGVLRGIDTSQLEDMGCDPIVYYSTIPKLQLSDETNPDAANTTNVDLDNREVWIPASEYTGDLADVKAIAIDCSNASKDADEAHCRVDEETGKHKFMLPEMESIVVNVNMQAPSGDEARAIIANKGAWGESGQAYNNAYLLCTSIDKDNPDNVDSDNFVRKDYTKVGMKEYSIKATKKWDDDNDRDGKRPETVTFRLFADGVEVKDERVSPKVLNVKAGETEVNFEHIPYTTPEGKKIIYTVEEDPIPLYTADQKADDTVYHFTNSHKPERTKVSGEKTWEGDEEDNRPASIDIELYGDGKKLKTQTVIPDANGEWKYEFTNLYKYENKKEIKYTVKEVKTPGTGNKLDSYIPEYDGTDIINTYHPYGDLAVSKTIIGTTEVSAEKEFTFTFTFGRKQTSDSGEEDVQPVFDEFEYEILNADGSAVTDDAGNPVTGTVSNNGEVTIKGGQKIHVKEIPQGISYTVKEQEMPGFVLVVKSGDSGNIIPNQTAQAAFTNAYSASGRINLEARKVLENRVVNKNQFSFELYEVNTGDDGEETEDLKATAVNAAAETTETREDGTVDYSVAPVTFGSIRYTQADHGKTFKYRMKEVEKDKDFYIYAKEIYEVDVTVTDNGDGTLDISKVYKDSDGNTIDTATFTNEYKASGSTKLLAWKSLPGRDLTDDEFKFELLDEKGDPVMNSASPSSDDETGNETGNDETGDGNQDGNTEDGTPVIAVSKANGTVTFSPEDVQALNYTEKDIGKTYYYAIREITGNDDTVVYDEHVYGYSVKIVDNGDGTLSAEQTLATPVFDTENPSKIVSWTTEGAVLPVFNNKLKEGGFSVTKTKEPSEFPEYEDPNQVFKFRVLLIGEDVTDETVTNYTLAPADKNNGADGNSTAGGQQGKNGGKKAVRSANTTSGSSYAANNSSGEAAVRAAGDIASGTYDEVSWRITSDGVLILGNGGEQTFTNRSSRSSGSFPWNSSSYRNQIKSIAIDGIVHANGSHYGMFYECEYATEADLKGFETSNMTNAHSMFHYCRRLKTVDVTGWDTGKVTDMRAMFNCTFSLETIKGIDGFDTSKVTDMGFMFSLAESLTSLDLSRWNTSSVSNMEYLFNGMPKLSSLTLGPNWNTSRVSTMSNMFGDVGLSNGWSGTNTNGKSSLDSLKTLDLSSFSIGSSTNMSRFFTGLRNLEEIKLGPNFKFRSGAVLNTPEGDEYTGRWTLSGGSGQSYTPSDLSSNYNSSLAGTWVWEKGYRVYFIAEDAAGGRAPQTLTPGLDGKLYSNTFKKFGYEFDHWVVTDSEGNEIEGAKTYQDEDTIPAGTYQSEEKVYLKAVFKPVDTSVTMHDGEFEFTLKAGEKAIFDNIPAGTSYQVYEETPKGWILVESENVAGTIEPLITSEAKFKNKFEPGSTQVQFYGTKLIDNKAAKAGEYSFVLKEIGNPDPIQTVSTMAGGFIQFSPITYNGPGEYKYTIEEADPGNDAIDWDTHKETVTVTVVEDEDQDLVATVKYDNDGIKFTNKTRPGILKLTKTADVTDANKDDEFTFRITLNNSDGMPLGSDNQIYWYTEKTRAADPDDSKSAGKQSLRSKVSTLLKTGRTKQSSAITGSNTGADNTDGDALSAVRLPVLKAGETRAVTPEPINFTYTGSPQSYVVPATGYYKLEAWGAQGGKATNSLLGGKGGYSAGTIYLEAGQVIYVYVGGQGLTTPTPAAETNVVAGGWNGGGRAGNKQIGFNTRYYGSGGGATDFRLTGGTWNNFDSLKSRIMVAGGGGGATNNSGSFPGGAGGGITGVNGTGYPWANMSPGYGGGQTYAGYSENLNTHARERVGTFGSSSNDYWANAGGGGGYYGGGSSAHSQSGGGGSGFVSGYPGCDAITENSTSLADIHHTGQPNHYSGMIFTDGRMNNGNQSMPAPGGGNETGHSGNGYARITPQVRAITYVPNGGTGDEQSFTYNVGDEIIIKHPSTISIERENYIFVGWSENADAVLPDYEAGDDVTDTIGTATRLYAVWMSEDEYLIHLDANGGFADTQWIRATDIYTSVTLPEPTKPGTDVFAGWNTKADGSGTMFYDSVIGEQIPAQAGDKVTLYAQWVDGVTKTKYKVEHYKQNATGSGYSLYETENLIGNRGDKVSPAEKDYEGYVCVRKDPDAESYTLPAQGEPDLVIKYYYDLCIYSVVYDGNGATSGQMNGAQEMKGGVQYNLLENKYSRKGYLFTGWNTAADGSGQTYVDKQKVKNLTKTNGATVTLYAQWLSNEENVLEPTNGEIIVKCKAGETIVIPDLPAGTTYTIEEIDNPAGWTQTGTVGTDGSIAPNTVSNAEVTNTYKAEGDALINAHKTLEGASIEDGQFTFELFTKDEDGNEETIETVTNGAVDMNEQVDDDEGNLVDNPYYDTSIVAFTPLHYSQADIGKTYTYYVRETGSVSGITLDEHIYKVQVKVEDAGGSNLNTTVTWTDTQGGLEPIFKNKMKPAELSISKSVISDAAAIPDTEFTFTMDLLDANGEPIEGTFETKNGDKTGSVQSGGTVKLRGGEIVTISGLPHGASYKVTEADVQNWEQTKAENTEGMLEPGESYEASFENKYTPPEKTPYTAEGSVVLKAKKTVAGGHINKDDEFTFELIDEEGNAVQSKGCDDVSTEDAAITQSDITFNEIKYTLEDLPYPAEAVEARVEELLKTYQDAYAEAKAAYEGQEPKPTEAFMTFEEYIRETEGKTLNKLLDELTEQAESEAVREKTFIYLVHEIKGDDPDVEYDTHTYYYKVRAWDNGQGKIETEVTKWKPGAEGEEDTQVTDIRFINSRSKQIKVYKHWSDNSNRDGYRPDKDTFASKLHLMNGDTEVTGVAPKITEDSDGNFTILYENLPAADEDGNEITYSVKEDGIDQYTAKDGKDTAEDGDTIMNVHEPKKTSITVTKIWDDYDDKYGKRAGAVFQLYKTVDGVESTSGIPIPVGTTDEWSYTWEDLPVNEGGKVITYSVKELLPDGTIYESSVSDPVVAQEDTEGVVNVTNTCNDKTEATVKKIWDDDSDKAGKRPETLTVELYQQIGEGDIEQAKDENDQPIAVTLPVDGKWEATVSDLPKYDPDANTIAYSWKETETGLPEGYALANTVVNGTVTTLTNKYTPEETPPMAGCEILISKVDEDGEEISGAVFEIYKADGSSWKKLRGADHKWLNNKDQFIVGEDPFSITGLEDGTYEIREVKSPEGYVIKIKKPVTFTVFKGDLDPAYNAIASNVEYEKLNDNSHIFTITNEESPGKVKTGDDSHMILYSATLLAALLMLMILMIRRLRRRTDR